MRGENVSAGQLAEEACAVEIDRLRRPIGKQDQYAAAFGGLNLIEFHCNEMVTLDPIWLGDDKLERLFSSSLVFWTGVQRDAATVLTEQRSRINDTRAVISAMRDDALQLREFFATGSTSRNSARCLIATGAASADLRARSAMKR